MKRVTLLFSMLAAFLVVSTLPAAAAVEVVFDPSTATVDQMASGVQVGIYIRGLPQNTTLLGAQFYLLFDVDSFEITNVQWDAAVLAVPFNPVAKPDGLTIQAAKFSGSGQVDPTKPIVTFTFKYKAGVTDATGDLTFNVGSEENRLVDTNNQEIAVDTWGKLSVTAGPPNAPDVTAWVFDALQKDPVQIRLRLSEEGNVPTAVRLRYRTPGGQWQNAAGAQINIHDKTVDITWDTPAKAGETATYELQAVVIDRTDQTGPWDAPSALDVDNQPPAVKSVTGFGTTVLVTFTENVDQQSATDTANYAIEQVKGGQGAGYQVTGAKMAADNRVRLTVNPALAENQQYRLTVQNVQDIVGNVMAATQKQFTAVAKPRLERVEFVGPAVIDVVFNGPMVASTVEEAGQWSVAPKAGGQAIGVSGAKLRADKVTVRLTLAGQLEQYSEYNVVAPAGAKNEAGQTLGDQENTIAFRTPFWHWFTAGVHLAGLPCSVSGRLRTILSAAAVAAWDPTANNGAGAYVIDNGGATQIGAQDGAGWWVKFNKDTLAIVDGQPIHGDVQLDLPAGWNIITNPYHDRKVDVNKLGGCLPFAWYWDGKGYQLVAHLPKGALNVIAETELEPWRGYFVKVPKQGTVTISTQAIATPRTLTLGGKDAALVQVVARAEGAEDTVNVCGVGSTGVKLPNPPRMPGSVDVYFVDDDGEPLAVDVRTGAFTQRWTMIVETDLPHARVTVGTPDLSRIPADYTVLLVDPATGQKTHLRTSSGYVFTSGENGARRRLILEIVPRSHTTVLMGVTAQQIGGGRVVVTYQLSGAASVTAKVLNIAGRVIKTLVADKAETAGRHSVGWNLDNDAGSPVPAGTYLIVLQARSENGQQTRVVRPLAVNR